MFSVKSLQRKDMLSVDKSAAVQVSMPDGESSSARNMKSMCQSPSISVSGHILCNPPVRSL